MRLQGKTQCCGCSACVSACPVNCITMVADQEGFLYPVLTDSEKCIDCKKCIAVCPLNSLSAIDSHTLFAAKNKDADVLKNSSSGGIFNLLAKEVLNSGGVVFGAAFGDGGKVKHIAVTNAEDLPQIMGSKYSQSDIGETFLTAKVELENGKTVMFSGTSCQVNGLKSFLQKEYDNLYCVDMICHGTPSPSVWKKYIEYRETIANSKVKKISFRDKTDGWKNYSVALDFENGTRYLKSHKEDAMMRAFLNDLCLRPYCHQCKFKGDNRSSDITLADFWGIEKVMPEFDDDKGASLVFVNSDKGSMLFDKLRDKILSKECDLDIVAKYNRSYFYSANLNKQRSSFMKKINSVNFDKIVKQYCDITFYKRLKSKICRVLHIK